MRVVGGLFSGGLFLLALQFALHTTAFAQAPLPPAVLAGIKQAQQSCLPLIHHDTDEFVPCIDTLAADIKGNSANAKAQRLGLWYMAWIGANNSARVSLDGAEAAAANYLPRFRRLQAALSISDDALCNTVAGNCKERVAQILAGERDAQFRREAELKSAAAKKAAAKKKTTPQH